MKRIIGFVANKESGKTTSFNFIKKRHPQAVEIMLAEHLKEACAKAFDLPLERFEKQEEKARILEAPLILTHEIIEKIVDYFELSHELIDYNLHANKPMHSTRQILQYVGTEVLRAAQDDIHLVWAMRRAPESNLYVVTDIRFPNEFEFFNNKEGFCSIALIRNTDQDSAHQSEAHIANLQKRCDHIILNNKTLRDLERQLESIMKSFLK